jgi:hypothetical protein
MIIALKGPAQCGKTTLANVLDAEFQYRGFKVKRTAFSDFVRNEIMDTVWQIRDCIFEDFGQLDSNVQRILDRQRFKTRTELGNWLTTRPADPESRFVQQWWGQDYRRPQDPLYWVKKSFEANVEYLLDPAYVVIEESCRQENEGRYVHALGGVVLDLKPLTPPTESEAAAMSHSVEQAAMSWKGDIEIDMAQFFAKDDDAQMKWTRCLVNALFARMESLIA